MAVSVVATPLVEGLINNLGSAAWAQLGLVWGVKDDIRRLRSLLTTINAVLEDAESRAISDKALRIWLKKLKDVAFDADDVLDEFQTEALFTEKKEKVRRFFSSDNTLVFRYKMARKIKFIVKQFDEIAEERSKFHLAERAIAVSHLGRETVSYQSDKIYGRDDDRMKIVKLLIDNDNDKDWSVLPVVGLGGLGKTTLARLVYNDENIMKHFENRIWVCVGENFDSKVIAKAMLERITKEPCAFSTLEDMHHLIREKITNKPCLLILDDVWNEDGSKWEELKNMLGDSTHSSKILVTTRSLQVAIIMGAAENAYKLGGLTDDDCWELFRQKAFGPGRANESPNLVNIGKEIVQRCGGLPLAAKSLGGVMADKTEEGEWLAIKNSELWNSDHGAKDIIPALQISYDHLSPQLKQCFAYCSVFPKDYQIEKSRLIQLWISQGFVPSTDGMHVEDIGNRFFNVLFNWSFFQDEQKDDFGNIYSCKMHDLVYALACFVANDESYIVEIDDKICFSNRCYYSSVIYYEGSSKIILDIACEVKRLRSFLLLEGNNYPWSDLPLMDHPKFSKAISNLRFLRALHLECKSGRNNINVLRELKHLRFLELSHLEVETLPDSITDLRNLQTLRLGKCLKLKELPESITDLRNLQTLRLGDCPELKELPKGMKMMSNLRHLDIGDHESLTGMPRGIGKLTNLQTLSVFHVGEKQSHATIAELQHLNQIRGELKISNLENIKDPKDAMEANLSSKSGLLSLDLSWTNGGEASSSFIDVLENLQPHPNLKSLSMSYYGGSRFPNWFTSSSMLPNLVSFRLFDLLACESLPPLGLLPLLKSIDLSFVPALKKIGKELYGEPTSSSFTAFPSLERMILENARNLEEWSMPERDAFPALKYLEILHCPKLTIHGRMPSSLLELVIVNINEGILAEGGCLQGLSRLTKLEIWNMESTRTSWKGLQYLTGLENLRICYCSGLISLPEGLIQHHFSILRTLELLCIANLQSFGGTELDQQHQPPPMFMSLHHLKIERCNRLSVLPEWLRGLTSLQSMTLAGCPNLQMLPEGLQHLPGLKKLTINRCRILEQRCERETGEDWYKISHIPDLTIIPTPPSTSQP